MENKAAAAYINSRRDEYVNQPSTCNLEFSRTSPDQLLSDVTRPSFASKMNAALKTAGDIDFSRCPEEEPDSWLDIDADNFDTMLQNMASGQPNRVDAMETDQIEEQLAQDQASKLKSLAKKVEEFVEGEGDLEGARFEEYVAWSSPSSFANRITSDDASDEFSEDMLDSDDDLDPQAETEDDDVAQSRLVPGLEPGEYGKMPPLFYANSQKVAPNPEPEEEQDNGSAMDEDDEPPPVRRPIRPPILSRDKFDGVDSDDESDEDELAIGNEDSDEDNPELVGEVEPDMDEEEEEFLEFSRRALGISNEQWNDIINERKNRGGTGAKMPRSVPVLTIGFSLCSLYSHPTGVETPGETYLRPSD